MIFRRRSLAATTVAVVAVVLAGACSSPSRSATSTTTAPATSSTDDTTSTTTPAATAIVFTTVDGAIDAYTADAPFTRQRVVAAGTAADGSEPHGQICFDTDGSRRFVVAESKPAGTGPASAGWGLYQLTGDQVGGLRVRRITGWTSPSGASTDAPTTYGCAFLSDGRLLTTDVGNQRTGPATGRLIEWFPPFDTAPPTSCTLSTTLATPLGLSADGADNVYLAAARAPGAGVWRFSGVYPADAGSCVTATVGNAPPNTTTTTEPGSGGPSTTIPSTTVPPTTAPGPTATHGPGPSDPASPGPTPNTPSTTVPAGPPNVTATLVVPAAPGAASAPTSVAVSPDAKSVIVASAPFGTITAYGVDGSVQATILSDPSKAMVGGTAFAGGTPLGVAMAPDSSLFYVDAGLVVGTGGVIAPAPRAGSVRKIATQPGFTSSPAPVTMNSGLATPDGIGVYAGTTGQSGGASIA